MAIETVYKPYLGAGQVYARAEGVAEALAPIGNVSELVTAVEEDAKKLTDYTKGGGGTYASARRITSVKITAKLHDLNRKNLARALFGDSSIIDAGVVATEAHTAYQGGLIRLTNIKPTAVTITSTAPAWVDMTVTALGAQILEGTHLYQATVAGTTGSVEPTWPTTGGTVVDGGVTWQDLGVFAAVADTDFEVRQEGIYILAGGIPDGAEVNVAYSHEGYDIVQALTQSGTILEMSFGGVNEADSNAPLVVDLFRVSLGAAKNIGFIGDDFASLDLEGELLIDTSKTGTGISRYMKISMA